MKVIRATQQMLETRTLVLGFQGENLRTQLRVDCSPTFAEYPNATPALAIKPPSGETYPVFVERDGNEVVWNIVANNLALKGDGELQLTFYKGEVIAKTSIGHITVNRSLQIDGEMPDVVATWIENANRKLAEVDAQIVELEGMVDTATDAATRAEQSASTASTKAEQAAGSAATATEKATEATNAAGTATAKAAEAEQSALTASTKASDAAESERIATAKAGDATTAATTATAKAEQATGAAQTATEKAGDASASATAAHASATDAASSATAASASETAAKASETAAGASATQAAQSAQNAGTAAQTATQKAAEATQSATNAAASATNAATSAETASTKAGEAAQSAQAVEETAEQLADSLEQIAQNTQDIAELDERKANIDGYYPDMTVGNAEQLNSSKYVENSEPYTLRTSGGTSDIGNREYLDAVVGGTLAWNQAVRDEASENQTDFADVVTVTDAVEDAAGVKVKIESVQDLHGYDHPWPAGGGKNLLDAIQDKILHYANYNNYILENGVVTTSGPVLMGFIVPVHPSTEYTFSFQKLTGPGMMMRVREYSDLPVEWEGQTYVDQPVNKSLGNDVTECYATFTTSATTTYVVCGYYFSGTQTTSNFQLEEGSTPTAWTPYSNICPITGWDGVKVQRTGKNLLNVDDFASGVDCGSDYFSGGRNAVTFDKVGTYTIKANTPSAGYLYARVKNADGTFAAFQPIIQSTTYQQKTLTITDGQILLLFDAISNPLATTKSNVSGWSVQIELSSTATDYEPYQGNTYDITLPTEAGTVYGGELTVNADGSGSLVVDKKGVVYDGSNDEAWAGLVDLPWRYSTIVDDMKLGNATSLYVTSNLMKTTTAHWSEANYGILNNMNAIVVGYPPANNDVAAFRAFLSSNPLQVVYLLATPITYTLTPTEIRTLLGTNNIWADTGDLALTYTGTDEHLTLESGKKYLSRISGTDSMLLGSGQEITAAKGTDNVFDLTQMFGSAVADYVYGQGAAFFRKWFGKQWYPYNAGELLSVEGLQSHDMVGFNLLNTDNSYTVGKNYRFVDLPIGADHKLYISFIEKDKSINVSDVSVGFTDLTEDTQLKRSYVWNLQNGVLTNSTSNLANAGSALGKLLPFLFVYPQSADAWERVNKRFYICVSLAHNNSRKGEYEPYEKHSYPLDSSVILRGIPKVGANGVYWDGDRYLPDGTVERRYMELVLTGGEMWKLQSVNSHGIANFLYDLPANYGNEGNSVCDKFDAQTSSIASTTTEGFILSAKQYLYIRISATKASTVEQFKAWLSNNPITLIYELATPTIETAQPYHSTQWVSDWGTEEFVSTGIVPVGTETRYPANLRDKLQHLPDAASGNGSYLITQTDGQMVLTPFPAPPSSAGNYVLKATVVNGVATYTWEVAT